MALPYSDKVVPRTRRGAEVLLESVGFEVDRLTAPQRQAVIHLYRLHEDRTVEQLVRAGEVHP